MTKQITDLNPQAIWKHFAAICNIPHPSGHTEAIADYLLGVGKQLGLESFRDNAGNVVIRKPATPGMENRQGVILQGHMDMVPQANKNVNTTSRPTLSYHALSTIGLWLPTLP